MTPIKVPGPTEIAIALMLTMPTLIYSSDGNPATSLEYFAANSCISMAIASAAQSDIFVDPKAKKWVKFQHLVSQWKEERGATSSITVAAMMPSYQKIVGMGEDAVPLLLKQLKSEGDEPDQWFWALKMIADIDPVKPEDQGNFRAMAHAWLTWGEGEGYAG